jgi:hypothetical protein
MALLLPISLAVDRLAIGGNRCRSSADQRHISLATRIFRPKLVLMAGASETTLESSWGPLGVFVGQESMGRMVGSGFVLANVLAAVVEDLG